MNRTRLSVLAVACLLSLGGVGAVVAQAAALTPAVQAEPAEKSEPAEQAEPAERPEPAEQAEPAEKPEPAEAVEEPGHHDKGNEAADQAGDNED